MEAPKRMIQRARALRKALSPPEARLWLALRKGAVAGARFRRQHPLGPFVLDFFCSAHRLCVEVDGWSHNMGPIGRDERRDAWLAAKGVRVLRFDAEDVRTNLDGVVREIEAAVSSPLGGSGPGGVEGGWRRP